MLFVSIPTQSLVSSCIEQFELEPNRSVLDQQDESRIDASLYLLCDLLTASNTLWNFFNQKEASKLLIMFINLARERKSVFY